MIADSLLIVLSRGTPGRDDDFNDWYSNIHIRDAIRFRAGLCSQRFAPVAGGNYREDRYHLAIYETSDAPRLTQEHLNYAGTVRMRTTTAFDRDWYSDYYYRPLSYWRAPGGKRADGPVVLEQYQATEGQLPALIDWIEDMVRARRSDPNQRSRTIVMFNADHQMLLDQPKHNVVMITRVDDLDAAQANWVPLDPPADLAERHNLSFWQPITPFLTIDDLLNPTSSAVAAEERARERMGSGFHPRNPKLG